MAQANDTITAHKGGDPEGRVAWWGPCAMAEGQRGCWRIGPLDLWLAHGEGEWQVCIDRPRDATDALLEVDLPCAQACPESPEENLRFAGAGAESVPELRLALADRPMVSRPDRPFYVPAGGEVTLFLSSPVWVQLLLDGSLAYEFPVYRPSDTWFGTSTVEGELCYATRTQARLRLEDVPERPHRAITPLTIRNQANDALFLERVKLPVRRLPVFADERQRLWTPVVHMEREADRDMAAMRVDASAPPMAPGARRIAEPREAGSRHLMVRAFSALFQ